MTMLTPPALEALASRRHSTLPGVRVQIDPFSRERDAYYVMRSPSGGWLAGCRPVSCRPRSIRPASERIKQIYASTDAAEAFQNAAALCVDYLMLGRARMSGA